MPKRILAVDDDATVLLIVKATLQGKGYEVITAENGEDAMNILKQSVPDLILLDVQMPTMNGYSFIMAKLRTPALASIPVIVLTASKETKPLFERHGIKAYLLKPINTQDLVDKVQQAIG